MALFLLAVARDEWQLNGELTAIFGGADDGDFAVVMVDNGSGDRHYQPDTKRNFCCKT